MEDGADTRWARRDRAAEAAAQNRLAGCGLAPAEDGLYHPVDGEETFALPENLYVLATMNTADRSIARRTLP